MSRFLIFFIPLLILATVVVINNTRSSSEQIKKSGSTTTAEINGVKISVETAKTPEEHTEGLSGREHLGENKGMLFFFEERRVVTFWMKGMKFPLDIIWIDDSEIVGVEKNAPTPTENWIPSFTSPGPVTHVLEVNAGFINKHGIKVGDRVKIKD